MSSTSSGLRIQLQGDVHVIEFRDTHVLGQMDVEKLKAEMQRLVDEADVPKLIISFLGVKQVSSSVLGMIIEVHKHTAEKDGAVRLCNIRKELRKAFKITGLDKILKIFDTTEKAMRKF
ncbi:MAG: hypothetical protein CMJ21_02455 [Phycisphaerae bacterium]|nr:hypothetical protein [Phycisphaerae bacterium]